MVFEKCQSYAHPWNPSLWTPESAPHKIPWPVDSLSQEIHHERSKLYLGQSQEQHFRGQREEALSRSWEMTIVCLHKGEGYHLGYTLWN